jgi:hypothetical protein
LDFEAKFDIFKTTKKILYGCLTEAEDGPHGKEIRIAASFHRELKSNLFTKTQYFSKPIKKLCTRPETSCGCASKRDVEFLVGVPRQVPPPEIVVHLPQELRRHPLPQQAHRPRTTSSPPIEPNSSGGHSFFSASLLSATWLGSTAAYICERVARFIQSSSEETKAYCIYYL